MFRSALFKLTTAFVIIVMSICLLFSLLLYRVTVHELETGFRNQYVRYYDAYQPFGLRIPAQPTAELAERSHHLWIQIMYLNMMILVIAAIVSYLLARRTLRPIEAAHEQQKRFTADVSHELRTPLTSIKMESEVSLLDPKTAVTELRLTLRSNLEEVGRMEMLVNNLLLLSSMEADKLRGDFMKLDIQEILSGAVAGVSKLADAKRINISTSLQSRVIRGEPASLTQMFIILLENAIKFSPEISTISITTVRKQSNIRIKIQDSGTGIAANDLPHIFDRFYRSDVARSRTELGNQGFGLGLSLAKLIADLHGAEIIISSAVGHGTAATVVLPTNFKLRSNNA